LIPDGPAIIPLPSAPVSSADEPLGKRAVRIVWHRGVELFGLRYSNARLRALRNAFANDPENAVRVEIRFNANDLGYIQVVDPRSRECFRVDAIDREYASGLSLSRHSLIQTHQNAIRRSIRKSYKDKPIEWEKAKERIHQLLKEDLETLRRPAKMLSARTPERSNEQVGTADSSIIDTSQKHGPKSTESNEKNSNRTQKKVEL
jgi:hypothetical protein